MKKVAAALGNLLACALLACGGETGTLEIAVSGEEAAVSGFPVEDGPAFVDGWSLTFETLVVALERFELRGDDGESVAIEDAPVLVDLTRGDQRLYTLTGVGARRWEDVRYVMAPPTEASGGDVDAGVRARMIAEGWSVYLEATATNGDLTRTLEWGLPLSVLNRRCVAGDETDGVVVAAGAITEGQITLHWDHLFFDSLRLDQAEMRFDAIAAAADEEGHVTLDALDAQRLADLRGLDGEPLVDADGAPIVYDPGSTALEEATLYHMVLAAARTVGHWQGEGHCDYATP